FCYVIDRLARIHTHFPYTTLFRSVGGRDFEDYDFMKKVLDERFDNLSFVECIVSGGAKGADTLAERYAQDIGRPVIVYRPDYKRDRKSTRLNSSHVKISYAVFCLK